MITTFKAISNPVAERLSEAFESSAWDDLQARIISKQIRQDPNVISQYVSIAHRLFGG